MAGGGAWGTNPYGAPQVLKQYGVQYEEYTDPDLSLIHIYGAVALHDPGGDLLVPLPGGVLHHHAVRGLGGLRRGHADAVVVVDFLDGDLGALLGDILIPGLAGALGPVRRTRIS